MVHILKKTKIHLILQYQYYQLLMILSIINYIIAEININKSNINKEIRIINSVKKKILNIVILM